MSKTNAVRKGKDQKILFDLIEIFDSISTSIDAKLYLACSLEYLNERIKKLQELNESKISYNPTLIEIYEFIVKFCENSYEGETSVIIVSALENLYYSKLKGKYSVVSHKVNQSGASSKEVGDIDIYLEDKFLYGIEVKDKEFTSYDLSHAFDKMILNSAKKGMFICGQNSSHKIDRIRATLTSYDKKGFYTNFIGILTYSRLMLLKTEVDGKSEFVTAILNSAKEINSKEATRKFIQSLIKELNWK